MATGSQRPHTCGQIVSAVECKWGAHVSAAPIEAVAYLNMIAKQKKSVIGDPRTSNHIWIHSCPQIKWPDEPYTTRSDIPAELTKEEPW